MLKNSPVRRDPLHVFHGSPVASPAPSHLFPLSFPSRKNERPPRESPGGPCLPLFPLCGGHQISEVFHCTTSAAFCPASSSGNSGCSRMIGILPTIHRNAQISMQMTAAVTQISIHVG